MWYPEQQLQRFDAREMIDISLRSIYRWGDRLEPFCQTGNTERTTIVGADLPSLVTYITAWLDATLDEMAVFIYNEGGGSLLPSGNFETSRDARHNKKEGFYRRLPDATAGHSVSSVGILELPPPLGIFQVPRRSLIDVDEFGATFERCNRTGGWAVKLLRV